MEKTLTVNGGIDITKFIASIFVVNIHTWPLYPVSETLNYIVLIISRLAVPYFFIASGYFFELKRSNNNGYEYKYLRRIFLLYLFWFIINIPIVYYNFFVWCNYDNLYDKIVNFILKLCFSSTFSGSWYLSSTILCVIIFSYVRNKRIIFPLSLILYILSIIGSVYYYIPMPFISNLKFIVEIYESTLHNHIYNSFAAGLLYFFVGTYIAQNKLKIFHSKKILFIIMTISICTIVSLKNSFEIRATDSFILLCPSAVLLFYISKNITTSKSYTLLRNASTIIYMSHFIFIFILQYFWDIKNTVLFFVVLFLSIFLSMFLIIASRNKKLGNIIKYSF